MKIEHTPEPWHVKCEKFNSGYYNPNAWPRLFAGDSEICGSDGFFSESLKQDKANAQRIVACVNACKGIDNKTLTHAGVVQRGELGDAIRQRDQLVEALLLCMNAVRLAGWENDYCMEKANEALELIQPTTKGEQHA